MAMPIDDKPWERMIRAVDVLRGSRSGITTSELADRLGVSLRTAQRTIASLRDSERFGPSMIFLDGNGARLCTDSESAASRFALEDRPVALDATASEIEALKTATDLVSSMGRQDLHAQLQMLEHKIASATPGTRQRLIETDLELSLQGLVSRPGPRPRLDTEIIKALRGAMLACHPILMAYHRRDQDRVSRFEVEPYGFLFGARHYLVAYNPHPDVKSHRTYVLGNIEGIEVLSDRFFEREKDFDLDAFAAESFGVWRNESMDVVLRFSPESASDVHAHFFHTTQVLEDPSDGSVIVRFRASGAWEICWHLFTWGDAVKVLGPPELIETYASLLVRAQHSVLGAATPNQKATEGSCIIWPTSV